MHKPNLELILMPSMACNLACRYCYVLDKHSDVMDIELAKSAIRQVVAANDAAVPTRVYWHGAEPLMAGLRFYRDICEWTRAEYGLDAIQHSIQTNGLLLNDEWYDFFIENHVTTGISLDGPPDLHNRWRVTRNGRGTFDLVFEKIMAARQKKLYFDVLCVVTRPTLDQADELWDFFWQHKIDFGFEPVVPENEWMAQELGLDARAYGEFAIHLFDRWFFQPERRLRMVAPLHHVLKAILSGGNSVCTFSENCGRHYLTVDTAGDVYPCILFAGSPAAAYGNLRVDSLDVILTSSRRQAVLTRRARNFAPCAGCRWLALCQGGCPYHAAKQHGRTNAPDLFCESYQMLFEHVSRRVREYLAPAPVVPDNALAISA